MTLQNQLREAEQLASQNGWTIVHRIIENGKSAYKKSVRRPAFEKAMNIVRRGEVDVFLVWKLDRFYRSGLECQLAIEELRSHGCKFASVSEPNLETETANGRAFIAGLAFGAEIRSEDVGKAISSWHRGNLIESERANGKTGAAIPAGWRPYGYNRPSKSVLEINEREASFIRHAADAILNGTGNFLSLIREFEPLSIQCTDNFGELKKGATPVPMSGPGLRRILINETTYGMRRGDEGELIHGCWDAILPIEMYAPMCALLNDPIRRTHDSSGNEIRHALTGIADCECGGKLRYRGWRLSGRVSTYRYYCRCGNSIDGPDFEAFVDAELWRRVTPSVWQGWRTSGKGYDPAVREAIEKRIAHINKRYRAGDYDNKFWEYDEMRAELDAQLESAVNCDELDIPAIDDIHTDWHSLPPVEQRKVYRQAFASITLHKASGNYDTDKRVVMA